MKSGSIQQDGKCRLQFIVSCVSVKQVVSGNEGHYPDVTTLTETVMEYSDESIRRLLFDMCMTGVNIPCVLEALFLNKVSTVWSG